MKVDDVSFHRIYPAETTGPQDRVRAGAADFSHEPDGVGVVRSMSRRPISRSIDQLNVVLPRARRVIFKASFFLRLQPPPVLGMGLPQILCRQPARHDHAAIDGGNAGTPPAAHLREGRPDLRQARAAIVDAGRHAALRVLRGAEQDARPGAYVPDGGRDRHRRTQPRAPARRDLRGVRSRPDRFGIAGLRLPGTFDDRRPGRREGPSSRHRPPDRGRPSGLGLAPDPRRNADDHRARRHAVVQERVRDGAVQRAELPLGGSIHGPVPPAGRQAERRM